MAEGKIPKERVREINTYMGQLYNKRMVLGGTNDCLIESLNGAGSWKYAVRKTCVTIEDYMMPFFWRIMADSIQDYYAQAADKKKKM